MPLGPDPELARAAVAQLGALRATVTAAEDDVLACLVVTGEPRPQRVLDDWLDQVADTLRAIGEQAADLSPTLARFADAARGTRRPPGCRGRRRAAGGRGGPVVSVVPGDPASLSACAGTARSVAERLGDHATGVRTASDLLGVGWTGRTSASTRRRAADLAAATDTTAAQLDRVGRVLQDHATDLADLVARGRALAERARAAGLEVRDGSVEIGWGVTGAADADADRARAATRSALQAELDLVLAQHRRRRDWVLGVLRDSTTGLSDVSHRLRGG